MRPRRTARCRPPQTSSGMSADCCCRGEKGRSFPDLFLNTQKNNCFTASRPEHLPERSTEGVRLPSSASHTCSLFVWMRVRPRRTARCHPPQTSSEMSADISDIASAYGNGHEGDRNFAFGIRRCTGRRLLQRRPIRAARPSGRARCGAGAGCSAIKYRVYSIIRTHNTCTSLSSEMSADGCRRGMRVVEINFVYRGTSLIRNRPPPRTFVRS